HRRPQVARVPASTELTWTRPETEQAVCGRFLLIPDTGGLSIPTFRLPLGRLVDLQRATGERLPVLVVATTSVARVRAWTTLVEQVSHARGGASSRGKRNDLGHDWRGHAITRLARRARASGRVCPRDLGRG